MHESSLLLVNCKVPLLLSALKDLSRFTVVVTYIGLNLLLWLRLEAGLRFLQTWHSPPSERQAMQFLNINQVERHNCSSTSSRVNHYRHSTIQTTVRMLLNHLQCNIASHTYYSGHCKLQIKASHYNNVRRSVNHLSKEYARFALGRFMCSEQITGYLECKYEWWVYDQTSEMLSELFKSVRGSIIRFHDCVIDFGLL